MNVVPRPDRRQLILGTAILATAGLANVLRPTDAPAATIDLKRAIPLVLGPYHYDSAIALVLPDAGETTQRIYDQVLTRSYVAAGVPPAMLVIAYGAAQDARLALHRPDACYPAAGYRIEATRQVDARPGAAAPIPATLLTATRQDRIEQVLYWTRIGGRFPTSALAEKLDILRANLSGDRPDGVLVRLSVEEGDPVTALAQLHQFVAILLGAIGPMARARLVGDAA